MYTYEKFFDNREKDIIIKKDFSTAIREIIKRDGRKVPFDENKIINAIKKSFEAVGEKENIKDYHFIADKVVDDIICKIDGIPTVEQVQDLVEESLIKKIMRKSLRLIYFIELKEVE